MIGVKNFLHNPGKESYSTGSIGSEMCGPPELDTKKFETGRRTIDVKKFICKNETFLVNSLFGVHVF